MTFTKVKGCVGGDTIYFTADNGDTFVMYHDQDCCECVIIDDIIGDLSDLVDTPILVAREDASDDRAESELAILDSEEAVLAKIKGIAPNPPCSESETWTFYNLRTIKGSVTIRWHGTSNGYYSESVYLAKV